MAVDTSTRAPPATKEVPEMIEPAPAYVGTWEKQAAARIAEQMAGTEQRPYMVSLSGIPGTGKTISSFLLQSLLENQHGLATMVVPHDGYHYPIEYLKTHFPDSEDAIYRRGAPDTFDPAGLHRDLTRIRQQQDNETAGHPMDDENENPRVMMASKK